MSAHDLFKFLVCIHILTGATGLISFWVPIAVRKGSADHRRWGRVFTAMMVITGLVAVGISLTTLYAPLATHPHLAHHPDFSDPALISMIFGWMMLYLAILTINLAWYGWICVTVKQDQAASRTPLNLALQVLLTLAAINTIWRGIEIGQPLVTGISLVGFATVATNLWYLYHPRPSPVYWLKEHVKAHVGAGISVYTAFFAFGAVRMLPEAALTPALWSVPLVTGICLILWHWRKIDRGREQRTRASHRQAPAE
ncbi:MAG: hypothetical protein R3287_13675 [Anderseniella sp.]|nr:hypothetical protein [Anderseniella sp.]